MNEQDSINHAAWIKPAGVAWLATVEGFTDPGERAAHARVTELVGSNPPILDLGVGAGRTVPLLRALSTDYVALDYTPVLVEKARERFPAVDIRQGDARDLSTFPDNYFGLVVFSYMGIDSVSHTDRQRVLREVRRVLRPGGVFWFSTLNQAGPALRRRPWQRDPAGDAPIGLARRLKRFVREALNYAQIAPRAEHGPGWSVAPFFAYSYGLLVHYITLAEQLDELTRTGFRTAPELFDDLTGARVAGTDALADVVCFNVIAHK